MKKVLVISYSQTGQLDQLVKSITAPLMLDERIELKYEPIKPVKKYPYPWDVPSLMDAFAQTVGLVSDAINKPKDKDECDLVILAFNVWFLSPPPCISAFLKSDYAKEKLKNKPVITVLRSSNMWLRAYQKVQKFLGDLGAKPKNCIVFNEQKNLCLASVSKLRRLLTGKEEAFWGIFPDSKLSKKDISDASRYGWDIGEVLINDEEKQDKPLLDADTYKLKESLLISERFTDKCFRVYGAFVRSFGKAGSLQRKILAFVSVLVLPVMSALSVAFGLVFYFILKKFDSKKMEKLKEGF